MLFTTRPKAAARPAGRLLPARATADQAVQSATSDSKQPLPVAGYLQATRAQVRDGAEAAFETRRAMRKSTMQSLPGFRTRMFMRRVGRSATEEPPKDEHNYVTLSIWDDKPSAVAYRQTDSFKESHGLTSIGSFLDTLGSVLRTLKAPPKPSAWEVLIPVRAPGPLSSAPAPQVSADAPPMTVPAEVFVTINRFQVAPGQEVAFEQRWATRDSQLLKVNGFRYFAFCRRDGDADDGFNYQSFTVWTDRAAFEDWVKSEQFSKVHSTAKKEASEQGKSSVSAIMSGPPSPAFYEGILVLEGS